MKEMLTERRGTVLHNLIQEYIATAVPVSSGRIARNFATKVSSATIRNELAKLEQEGKEYRPGWYHVRHWHHHRIGTFTHTIGSSLGSAISSSSTAPGSSSGGGGGGFSGGGGGGGGGGGW